MKKAFLTGLIILLPITLTIMLFTFLIDFFTAPFLDVVRHLFDSYRVKHPILFSSEMVTILSRFIILLCLIAFTFFLGFITQWFFIHWIIQYFDKILYRIPFIRSVFKVSKDIAGAIFKRKEGVGEAFKHPTLVPFPSEKSDCVGFVTGSVPPECDQKVPNLVPVFVPTAPHPISGYLMLVPSKNALDIEMTNEEAVRLTVSCGMILSESEEK